MTLDLSKPYRNHGPRSACQRIQRSFQPAIEGLEERTVPAVMIDYSMGLLRVDGTARDDAVVIMEDHKTNMIVITENGYTSKYSTVSSAGRIDTFSIHLKEGNDSFHYGLLGGSNFTDYKYMFLTLGTGDYDSASINLFNNGKGGKATLYSGFDMRIDGNGTGGRDGINTVEMWYGDVYLPAAAYDTDVLMYGGSEGNNYMQMNLWGNLRRGQLDVDMHGGFRNDMLKVASSSVNQVTRIDQGAGVDVQFWGAAGNDSFDLLMNADLDGFLRAHAQGGQGDDTLDAYLKLDDGSEDGSLDVELYGDNFSPLLASPLDGVDRLYFHLYDNSGGSVNINALVDGGSKSDYARTTANVQQQNI